jgi:hypothetical protein
MLELRFSKKTVQQIDVSLPAKDVHTKAIGPYTQMIWIKGCHDPSIGFFVEKIRNTLAYLRTKTGDVER